MTNDPRQLVRRARLILLDFDGPMTPLMPPPANRDAANRARAAAGAPIPTNIADTSDHLAVIRWAATQPEANLDHVEKACIEAELHAARISELTTGVSDFLRSAQAASKTVTIVTNNAAEAVHTFLNRSQLAGLVHDVIGRAPLHPDLMKPHPSQVLAALELSDHRADDAVLVGDSVTDVEVAQATGVRVIGYAKTPERGEQLADAGADALTASMTDLAVALRN